MSHDGRHGMLSRWLASSQERLRHTHLISKKAGRGIRYLLLLSGVWKTVTCRFFSVFEERQQVCRVSRAISSARENKKKTTAKSLQIFQEYTLAREDVACDLSSVMAESFSAFLELVPWTTSAECNHTASHHRYQRPPSPHRKLTARGCQTNYSKQLRKMPPRASNVVFFFKIGIKTMEGLNVGLLEWLQLVSH